MLVSLISATVFNFINEFPSSMMTPGREADTGNYMTYYYTNTLTRAPPFFVGMIFGYELHCMRGKKIHIPKIYASILWIFTFALFATAIYATYPAMLVGWDNQTGDSMINSFQRPAWALGLGWLIVACVHGYGGPIGWLLSLQVWKLPARISYAMYITHWTLMSVINGSRLAPPHFTVENVIYNFLGQYTLTFIFAFVVTVFIDSPCSILFQMILGKGNTVSKSKNHRRPVTDEVETKEDMS